MTAVSLWCVGSWCILLFCEECCKVEWLNISVFHHRALVENGAGTWTIVFWKVIIAKRSGINLSRQP
jgi:hypothetical protein